MKQASMVGSFDRGDLTYDSIQFVGPVQDEIPFGDVSSFYNHAKIQSCTVHNIYICKLYICTHNYHTLHPPRLDGKSLPSGIP